jgi:hypothetical protein
LGQCLLKAALWKWQKLSESIGYFFHRKSYVHII